MRNIDQKKAPKGAFVFQLEADSSLSSVSFQEEYSGFSSSQT